MQNKLVLPLFVLLSVTILLYTGCSAGGVLPESQRLTGESRMQMRSGDTYLRSEVYDRALEQYLYIIEDNPNNLEALKKAADIYFFLAEQEPGRAREYYSKAYDHYLRVKESYDGIEEPGVFPILDEIVEDSKLKKRACWARLFNIGQNYFAENHVEPALETFYELIEFAPDSTKTYIMIASIYQAQDDAEQANDYFLEIARMDKEDTISRSNLASFYFENQDFEQSLRWTKELIELEHELANNYFFKGVIHSNLEQYEDAISAFEKSYENDEAYIDALVTAADLSFNLEMYENAIDNYKTAIEKGHDEKDIYAFLLYSLLNLERYEEMLKYGLNWYELDKTNLDAVHFIMLAANRTNNVDIQREFAPILEELEE